MKFLSSAVQKLSSEQTHRQTDGLTDRHTDTQTGLKLLPTTYADGKKSPILILGVEHQGFSFLYSKGATDIVHVYSLAHNLWVKDAIVVLLGA